jgi:hypothetical protein
MPATDAAQLHVSIRGDRSDGIPFACREPDPVDPSAGSLAPPRTRARAHAEALRKHGAREPTFCAPIGPPPAHRVPQDLETKVLALSCKGRAFCRVRP